MKIHLAWIRVTAAVVVAGVIVQQAVAQYAPYRPLPQQPAAPVPAVQAPAAPQQAQPIYTAYRTPAATPTAYGSPTGAQYAQPTAAYPQYPQTTAQYPQTTSQYPATYGSYPYVAQQQPTEATLPSPKNMNQSAAQPSTSAAMGGAPMNGGMTGSMSAAQPGGCNCSTPYGAGDFYSAQGCGCTSTGYPNCGISNYFANDCGPENQWFGGVYFLEMGRTNATPVKLTSQMPPATAYPYYPQPVATVMTNRDVNFDFREGLEVRVGSTFTIGEPCSTCQSACGPCNGGCGNCGPVTTYAWEVAWWGIDNSPNEETTVYDGTNRIYGMKSFVGLEYDRDGAGGAYAYRPVNDYYDYEMPITAPPGPSNGYVRVVSQRVRTDFRAQNLELNFIRFPVCEAPCGGCNSGCNTGCNAAGCSSNYSGCNGDCGCDDSCGLGFSMYGSCGVRYFHLGDEFMYASEFQEYNAGAYDHTYGGYAGTNNELYYNVDVKNNLVGPQVGWTTDYCWGKWNLFCNSTFGIFDNHMSVWQRMQDGTGQWTRFTQDGTNFNVRTTKDAVAFMGELRVGTAYDFSCHWRGVIAYRAVALSGVATAAEQMSNAYTDRATVGLIDSDNSVIIHGAQVGAECRY